VFRRPQQDSYRPVYDQSRGLSIYPDNIHLLHYTVEPEEAQMTTVPELLGAASYLSSVLLYNRLDSLVKSALAGDSAVRHEISIVLLPQAD
jgi:hypothetical protein